MQKRFRFSAEVGGVCSGFYQRLPKAFFEEEGGSGSAYSAVTFSTTI